MKKQVILFILSIILSSCISQSKKIEKDFFCFEPDIRLFTSYAFINAAGYNHDWNEVMHPMRVEVRHYLDSILPDDYKDKIKTYYKKSGGGNFHGYGVYALNSAYPPDFGLSCDTDTKKYLKQYDGLDSLLREFYIKGNIEELWNVYKDKLYKINLRYKPFAEQAIRQVTSYCRVDSNFYQHSAKGNFYYQQIPLMSYYTAFCHETENDYWVVSGPSDGDPGPGAFYHESLHKIINPIVEKYSNLNIKISSLVELSQERLKGDYYSDTALLCESFVRTIDKILSSRYYGKSNQDLYLMVEDEYKLGHILSFYLMENLPDYELSGLTLDEYYPSLLNKLDVEYEKNRWESYWSQRARE